MITLTVTIPIPPATPLGVAGRVFTVADELVAELNALDGIRAAWAMHVGAADVTAAPLPAIAASFSPNGHAPEPEPQPEPEPAPQKSFKGNRYNMPTDELRGRALAEMQRLAVNGVAPSMARWDEDKDDRLPTAASITHRLKLKWGEICALAGLESRDNAYKNSLKGQGIGVRVAAVDDDDDGEEDAAGDDAGF